MDIPYGFDCYAFQREEIKYFERNIFDVKKSVIPVKETGGRKEMHLQTNGTRKWAQTVPAHFSSKLTTDGLTDYIKFTRKNEEYPKEQVMALGRANRLNLSEVDKRLFCGIKIQLGIGVVTSFLRRGLQYKPPVRGRSEIVNGSWTGIMKGLTVSKDSPISYDLAFGNFLAWAEEFPYIRFGPFFAVESKLVMLTGSSRQIEASSFGTNITKEIWITILLSLLVLSILASLRVHLQTTQRRDLEQILRQIQEANIDHGGVHLSPMRIDQDSIYKLLSNFCFIYMTMLLNKPSLEFDELIWPRVDQENKKTLNSLRTRRSNITELKNSSEMMIYENLNKIERDKNLKHHLETIRCHIKKSQSRCKLPTSIKVLSYMWSAACLVIASIYSGEMLAVMLLHADTNIDTISQLINSKPAIEPVIRQDDFTYQLMLKSLDENMLKLHNKTRIIPRQRVYTRQFIESVSQRKVALLGDDELIETIYDLYHKYFPLHKSKMTYLQYPISIMYRKDLNSTLEFKLRRGLVQMFEMGLIHRWYQAQKDTYIKFYDTYERKINEDSTNAATDSTTSKQKYKPLSMAQFTSFFRAMFYCILFSFVVLVLELLHHKFANKIIRT